MTYFSEKIRKQLAELGLVPTKKHDPENLMNYLGIESFKCEIGKCGYMFLKKDMLDSHIKKVHGFKNQSSLMEIQKIKVSAAQETKLVHGKKYDDQNQGELCLPNNY